MDLRLEWRALAGLLALSLGLVLVPLGAPRFDAAVLEGLLLAQEYARLHVLLCLVPAFFIAGALGVFLRQEAILRYLGPGARKGPAYAVASVSGSVLAVCSCTVLPLFSGIHRLGAGLGPATAFLYSGPAINVLAVVLTASVLGWELGLARAVGAIAFAVVVGLLMHALFRREERERSRAAASLPAPAAGRPLWQSALVLASLVAILVFANLGRPQAGEGLWWLLWANKWRLTALAALALAGALVRFLGLAWWKAAAAGTPVVLLALLFPGTPQLAFGAGAAGLALVLAREGGELGDWLAASWGFAKQILPLLFAGVLVAGILLGRPGHEGLVPSAWVAGAVGGEGLGATLFAAAAGALMYFATLTEVPILQGLLGSGMGQGPALALLLAGPALSLPSVLVIAGVLGWKKTLAYVGLVVGLSTLAGLAYGNLIV
ncbi:MAG TPA: permease [Thermoanaerobaculia bacterium]|nr:permease [Thermoanaerobaculia bacterium]